MCANDVVKHNVASMQVIKLVDLWLFTHVYRRSIGLVTLVQSLQSDRSTWKAICTLLLTTLQHNSTSHTHTGTHPDSCQLYSYSICLSPPPPSLNPPTCHPTHIHSSLENTHHTLKFIPRYVCFLY